MGFPFRFYGHGARDWYEGANAGHVFSVKFARVPTEAERRSLGELYERTLATGVARPASDPWLWSRQVASFRVGERWTSSGGHVGAVATFLLAAHKLVPLVDVLYVNARAPGGRWDAWSRATPPDPGPDEKSSDLVLRRPIDPTSPASAPDEAFEDGRQRGVTAIAVAKADEALAAPRKPGKVGLARVPDNVDLEPADDGEARPDLSWIEGDATASPDGKEALSATRETAFHIDLTTRAVTTIHERQREDGLGIAGVGWLDGGARWAVFADDRLLVFDPKTRGLVGEHRARCTASLVARGGKIVVVSHYGKDPKVLLVHDDKLKVVGTFKAKLDAREVADRIVLYAAGTPYELTHVDEVLAALKKKPKPAAKQTKKRASAAAAPTADPPPDLARLGLGAGDAARVGANGRLIGMRGGRASELVIETDRGLVDFNHSLGQTGADLSSRGTVLLSHTSGLFEAPVADFTSSARFFSFNHAYEAKTSAVDVLGLPDDQVLLATLDRVVLLGPAAGALGRRKKLHDVPVERPRGLARAGDAFIVKTESGDVVGRVRGAKLKLDWSTASWSHQ